ncbi:MAG: hypothetical protein WCG99_00900 [Candidatus Berkelbacteria bacterium]
MNNIYYKIHQPKAGRPLVETKPGYVTLIGVLVVSAVGLVVATSMLFLGLSYSRSSLALSQSDIGKSLADACAEDALQRIRDNTAYSGTNNLTINGDSCTSTVTAGVGQIRTIDSSGTINGVVRKVKVTISQISPKIIISSWQEVADF